MVDVVIVGAGASGLVAAIVAARRGKRVLIVEKNNKVGKKLLATGNGRCNITNQRPTSERFYSQSPSFIPQVLEGHSYQSIKQFFKSIGLELIEAKEGKAFPMSLQASSVVDLLAFECEQLGVQILCACTVHSIGYTEGAFTVTHDQGKVVCEKVVLATGHQSAPQLGGVMDGVAFAQGFGHRVIKGFPTLVQLTSPLPHLKRMAGVKVEGRVRMKAGNATLEKQGDILFTNYGLSGLAILDISRFVLDELRQTPTVTLALDIMPKMSREQLIALMKKSLRKKSQKPLETWLQGFLNRKLILPLLEPLRLPILTESQITPQHIEAIVDRIKHFPFPIDGSRGYKGAEVATGGVDTREVNPKTMESKKQKGLYLTGELLDVDGDRGGFNLHFAWVTGIRAGEAL
ncbi:MAG TPA: NAD(P)/FAD-dependent oxidoreductase [Campylobacterales bacterium]|nr:NAD(P)/FAD-dependent oxidoreductase [Campylobacterales bacterium]